MGQRFASLDYSPWLARLARGWFIVLVTLTYPGDWLALVPSSAAASRHLRIFRARLERATGATAYAIWKREFQRRGAPHYHLLLPPPAVVGTEAVRTYIALTWFDVVGSGDARHLHAGTGLDWAHGVRAVDPVRVARYFAGHASPSGHRKEYQQVPPAEWLRAGVGRYWGWWGLRPAELTVSLDREALIRVRRLLRGIDRSSRRVRTVSVQRIDRATGRIYRRHVHRRSVLGHLASGSLTGATVFVPDGPAVAQAVAEYLRQGHGRP